MLALGAGNRRNDTQTIELGPENISPVAQWIRKPAHHTTYGESAVAVALDLCNDQRKRWPMQVVCPTCPKHCAILCFCAFVAFYNAICGGRGCRRPRDRPRGARAAPSVDNSERGYQLSRLVKRANISLTALGHIYIKGNPYYTPYERVTNARSRTHTSGLRNTHRRPFHLLCVCAFVALCKIKPQTIPMRLTFTGDCIQNCFSRASSRLLFRRTSEEWLGPTLSVLCHVCCCESLPVEVRASRTETFCFGI